VSVMKIVSKRAAVVLVFALLLVFGVFLFTVKYVKSASNWAQYPTNRHLYTNGQLTAAGTIYDRNGVVLAQTVDGERQFNKNKTVRKAVMHAVGDKNGNIATGAQLAFGKRLSGWDLLNGVYRFQKTGASGNDLTLTLDADLCAVAYQALNGRKGTVGVYNYKTGEILCMVSSPSFDPENPPDVEADPEQYEGVYINRFLSAAYTPGSVFKLVTAAAAIDKIGDIETKVYHCDGELEVAGELVTCPSSHGDVTFGQALADSCNVTFAQISLELGAATLQKYAEKAGFNAALSVDGIQTATGKVDLTKAEGGSLAWAGIGQYSDTANPLNFMAYMGAIANGGVRVFPKILDEPSILPLVDLSLYGEKRVLSKETAETLSAMMRDNVKNVYGENQYKGLELCAKSGTAEVGAGKKPHAWFAGFLDREDCPLAFVVVIENGGSGSKVAGPVASKVMQAAVKSLMVE